MLRILVVLALLLPTTLPAQLQDSLLTDFEKSEGRRSPLYRETVEYGKRLEQASPFVRATSFGTSPQGRELPLLIFSTDRAFTPKDAQRTGKPILLIQSGIHAGEIDGKDASFLLLRDLIRGRLKNLASEAILLVIPIFNVDGHERQSPYHRINQNGPEEMGWRTTAQNFNLNRDFLKADAPEMQHWLRLFDAWKPDLVVDIHVTDGIDFQYNLTYSMEMFENAPPRVVAWHKAFEAFASRELTAMGEPIIPYVFPREDHDLSKGLSTYAAPPRFSTGYVAIRNRAALLVETHMMKPYAVRVTAVHRLLEQILRFLARDRGALRRAVEESDRETTHLFSQSPAAPYPIRFMPTDSSRPVAFLGYELEWKPGPVSGTRTPVWHHDRPTTVTIPFYDDVRVTQTVTPPWAYLVPRECTDLLGRLRLHGVRTGVIARDTSAIVETLVFRDPKWQATPYEGRHPLRVSMQARRDTIPVPAGTVLVRLDQPSAKAAIHLLEPDAPDSFVAWGFFDAIFEQKEYFESYVMEDKAQDMMQRDPALAAAFRTRLASDSAFAANPRARLQFFYERSPWFDARFMVYPVSRVLTPQTLPLVEPKERR